MRTIKCVDILLPKVPEPEKWAVVSCDQFTSQREYWKALEGFVGDAPSTLKLIFPEVYLEDSDAEDRVEKINATMKDYLANNVFYTLKDSFILVKRDTEYRSRLGLIVAIDLEEGFWDTAPVLRIVTIDDAVQFFVDVLIDAE